MPDEGNFDPPSSQLYREGYLNFISTTKMGEKLENTRKKKRDGRKNLTFFISLQLKYIDLTKVLVIFPSTLFSEKMLFFISSSGTLVCKRSASCQCLEPTCPCHDSYGPPVISVLGTHTLWPHGLPSLRPRPQGLVVFTPLRLKTNS